MRDCKNKQTTIIEGLREAPPFALCEDHYNEFTQAGEINCTLDWD